MTQFTVKRRKLLTSYFSFALAFAIFPHLFRSPAVTIETIITSVRLVKTLLRTSQQISNNTVYALNVTYKELGRFLFDNNFSTAVIQKMEKRYIFVSETSQELRYQIRETNSAANKLFSLLEKRANQNSTPELKKKMTSDIREKKTVFREKMKIANGVLSQVEISVKKYDDILGYIQVTSGLRQVDQYIKDVDAVIAQAEVLHYEIQSALRKNEQIVASFESGI